MRLLILSDLHLEFGADYRAPVDGYDVVILAGDVASPGHKAVRWAGRPSTFGGRSVIMVAGNHEYYGHTMDPVISAMESAESGSNVRVLDGNEVVIDGVRFLGATLWTDFGLGVVTNTGMYSHVRRSMDVARQKLNDYRVIRTLRPRTPEAEGSAVESVGVPAGAAEAPVDGHETC